MVSSLPRLRKPPRISLALQGGGAHGAFTWGVLDAFLEDGRYRFDGVSGTSAGAMNAVVLAHGLMQGGRDGAREALETFWTAVAKSVPFELAVPTGDGKGISTSPALSFLLDLTHYFSPYQLNPFDLNPLRDVVAAQIDFERLRRRSPVHLFIAATHANTGVLRLFTDRELSVDAVLASACLPKLHRAIEIDGEPYWDGGYSANPAVFPLFYECVARDILLVLLAPPTLGETPRTAREIQQRAMEIGFNNAFQREMRMLAHAREFVARSWWPLGRLERRLKQMRLHSIEADAHIGALPYESKLAANLGFFHALRDMGRARARGWLETRHADVGRISTLDLAAAFGGHGTPRV